MRLLRLSFLIAALLVSFAASAVHAAPLYEDDGSEPMQQAAVVTTARTPYFSDGFAVLSDELGVTMGDPIEGVHPATDESGDLDQLTSTGIAYYRPDTNTPAFFDGVTRYALTSWGVVKWTGDQLDPPAGVISQAKNPSPDVSYGTPRGYLYAAYPKDASFLDHCVITNESHWDPNAKNSRSTATGLGQILNTTWAFIPSSVTRGRSRSDPYANIDGSVWLLDNLGPTQWEVYLVGKPGCR